MSSVGLQKRDYNFFASAIDSQRSARKKAVLLIFIVLFYLILVSGAYFILDIIIRSSQNKIDTIESYLSTEEVSIQRELATEKKMQINNLKQYIESLDSFLNYIQQADIINTEYIGQITSAIPEGLYFDNVSMTDEHLQIQGTAPNRQIIAEYLNNMKALDLFTKVHISNITTVSTSDDTGSEYSFVMNCQLKGVMEE